MSIPLKKSWAREFLGQWLIETDNIQHTHLYPWMYKIRNYRVSTENVFKKRDVIFLKISQLILALAPLIAKISDIIWSTLCWLYSMNLTNIQRDNLKSASSIKMPIRNEKINIEYLEYRKGDWAI